MIKKIITIILLLTIGLATVPLQLAHAQRGIDPTLKPQNVPGMPLTGLDKDECIKEYGEKAWDENTQMCKGHEEEPITAFLQVIGGALLMLAGGIAVIVIAIGGVMYIISRGNTEQMEKAKKTLLYGVIGMLVIIFSYFIISYVLRLIIG